LRLDGEAAEGDAAGRLLTIAVATARRRDLPFVPELDTLDRRDFLTYVATQKGNLRYATFDRAQCPRQAATAAGQAKALAGSLAWYLDLYRLFEEVRREAGIVTFSDMLLTGWEALVRFPDVLAAVQQQYQCVLVDEYQDINRAQAEILDLITAPARNYMAIGDDDQTIYEWRGARPEFILRFAQRYDACTYVIGENFRCPAAPLALANRVIAHNRTRAAKRLRLTRGFHGNAVLHVDRDVSAMAERIVGQVKELHEGGLAWRDMVILVRLHAQTPPLEQALITASIPFRVSRPFYERAEIKTLIAYVRLAWIERAVRAGQPLSARQGAWFSAAWRDVYNRPTRYLSRALHDEVRQAVLFGKKSPAQALRQVALRAYNDRVSERMELLADDLQWLAAHLEHDAAATLRNLEVRLDYAHFLRESSGFPQTGQGRAAGVYAFISYAQGKGTLLAFLKHVRALARTKVGRHLGPDADAVLLSTIHGAKGLEWPAVFVAQCNQGTLPFNGERAENPEEERRLFYVALTRSSSHLFLHAVKQQPLSPFLAESEARRLLPAFDRVRTLLRKDPDSWRARDALLLARTVAEEALADYFRSWWEIAPARQHAVATTVAHLLNAIAARDAWAEVHLAPASAALWRDLGAAPPAAASPTFPGLDLLLARSSTRPATLPADTPSPARNVRPGMWLHCDAGWSRVGRILDATGRERSAMPLGDRSGTLHVILRPSIDALPAVVDLEARRIAFAPEAPLYTCTRCEHFSAHDPHLIGGAHNNAAHDGLGPRYRREREPVRRLRHLAFQEGAPADELV
jgi:DNA helicase-2/ATP-dependent DNA helicase PcrA